MIENTLWAVGSYKHISVIQELKFQVTVIVDIVTPVIEWLWGYHVRD